MHAIAYKEPRPLSADDALLDLALPRPTPSGRELLVEVKAVSVNPVDVKIRAHVRPEAGTPKVLGWDAAGVVVSTGPQASLFKPGDTVYYAGALDHPGTNARFHLVDERIVGPKPETLDFAQAAAMPLTTITAWEALFDRLDVLRPVPGGARTILIIGGAGGVGSMAVQLARALTDLTVIASASRPESSQWVQALGAHHVVDHSKSLANQLQTLGLKQPSFVFSTTHTAEHMQDIAELIAPQGRFALIDDPKVLDVIPLKRKSVSLHWEFMFTRSLLATTDIEQQHGLLAQVAHLIDEGRLRTTLRKTLRPICALTLKQAHALVERDQMVGKVVVADWDPDQQLTSTAMEITP